MWASYLCLLFPKTAGSKHFWPVLIRCCSVPLIMLPGLLWNCNFIMCFWRWIPELHSKSKIATPTFRGSTEWVLTRVILYWQSSAGFLLLSLHISTKAELHVATDAVSLLFRYALRQSAFTFYHLTTIPFHRDKACYFQWLTLTLQFLGPYNRFITTARD